MCYLLSNKKSWSWTTGSWSWKKGLGDLVTALAWTQLNICSRIEHMSSLPVAIAKYLYVIGILKRVELKLKVKALYIYIANQKASAHIAVAFSAPLAFNSAPGTLLLIRRPRRVSGGVDHRKDAPSRPGCQDTSPVIQLAQGWYNMT